MYDERSLNHGLGIGAPMVGVSGLEELIVEFAVGKLDVKQRVLEGNDLLSPLAVQGDGNLGHSIFSSSVSRG